ncbi:MAG TPA: hypothetical protein VMV74_08710 [Bacteroidales bacterium]|nr:hypothetical protein [Bacteroidales bacterium]
MKSNLTDRPLFIHAGIILIFTIISFAYFFPVLEGKKLNAHDTKVFVGSSKEIQDYRNEFGKEPLWTNSMFGGMPAFLISAKFPGNLIKHLDGLLKTFKTPVAALFLAFVGFYILLLLFKVKPWLALAGALAYGFTSYLFVSLSAGHNTKVYAMAYMAPVIGSVVYAFRANAFRGSALFALFLSLQIMANHIQITYYTFLILIVFGIYELIHTVKAKLYGPFLKSLILLFAGAIIAIGVNFGTLYTTWEYAQESTRGKSDLTNDSSKNEMGLDKEYITQWSYGIGETMTLLVPDFRGGATVSFDRNSETIKALRKNNMAQASSQVFKYWGKQPLTSGPVYFGAIILFLFVFGLIIIPGREKWWILTAVLLSLFLSWGKNFMPLTSLFIDYFPGYDRFRAVSMILVIAGVCVPLLAVLALKEITDGKVPLRKTMKALGIATGVTGGLAFLFFLLPGLAGSFLRPDEVSIPDSYSWLKDAMIADRKMMMRTDAIRAALLIAAGAATLWFYLKDKLKPLSMIVILGVLFLIDQIPVDARFLNGSNFESKRVSENSLAPSAADKAILQDKSEFRVLNLTVSTFNDASTSYYHNSVGGYSGAKLKRYQELIETRLSEEINSLISLLQNATSLDEATRVLKQANALNMLNTKYIILSPDAAPIVNSNALGNVWLVEKTSLVENANAELDALKTIDPASEVVVDRRFADLVTVTETPAGSKDTIYLSSYQPNLLIYETNLASDRMAVFSEIYYPHGWTALIDGETANHFRTDYVLRGMVVPAGQHTITFKFEPQSYKTGNRVSMASSIILILLLVWTGFSGVISSHKNG